MILHLFDDEKVVNRCIESFEKAFPDDNLYICFHDTELKHVKPHRNLHFCGNIDVFDNSLLSNIDRIIIHYLNLKKVNFILKHNLVNIPVYWCVWGADLYNTFLVNRGYSIYYEPQFLGKLHNIKILIKKILLKFSIISPTEKYMLNFIKDHINYLVSSVDFFIAKQFLGNYIKGEQVKNFNYYPIENVLGNLSSQMVNGNIIMIGNSASFTNNHSYAFKYLSKLNIKGKQIVTPLNYGGSPDYIKHIIKQGKRIWTDSYKPLLDFLPLDEYNKLMLSSEICIFSNWRQEAAGNIRIALYLGAKVFMSEKSPFFHFLQEIGVNVFSLENMSQEDLDIPLDDESKKRNRDIIFNLYNEKSTIENIRKIWEKNLSNKG